MAEKQFQSNNLGAGEFYGQVPGKRLVDSSVMTEVFHRRRVSVPRHSHELGHFQLFLEGSYQEILGGKTFSPSPMTLSWHRPGMIHKDEIGNDGGRFFVIELPPRYIQKLEELIRLPDDFYIKGESLVWLACRQYYEFKNWQTGSDLISEGLTLEMLGQLVKNQSFAERKPPRWLQRIVEKLNEEFTKNFSIEELAAESRVHQVHLATVFRQFYGETIGEYTQQLRVTRASKLLFNKQLSLVEIAGLTGFSDQSHMTRAFKRFIGVTPGAFRQALE